MGGHWGGNGKGTAGDGLETRWCGLGGGVGAFSSEEFCRDLSSAPSSLLRRSSGSQGVEAPTFVFTLTDVASGGPPTAAADLSPEVTGGGLHGGGAAASDGGGGGGGGGGRMSSVSVPPPPFPNSETVPLSATSLFSDTVLLQKNKSFK